MENFEGRNDGENDKKNENSTDNQTTPTGGEEIINLEITEKIEKREIIEGNTEGVNFINNQNEEKQVIFEEQIKIESNENNIKKSNEEVTIVNIERVDTAEPKKIEEVESNNKVEINNLIEEKNLNEIKGENINTLIQDLSKDGLKDLINSSVFEDQSKVNFEKNTELEININEKKETTIIQENIQIDSNQINTQFIEQSSQVDNQISSLKLETSNIKIEGQTDITQTVIQRDETKIKKESIILGEINFEKPHPPPENEKIEENSDAYYKCKYCTII